MIEKLEKENKLLFADKLILEHKNS